MIKWFENMGEFQEINLNYVSVTNEIVESIIKHCPDCLKCTFENCGNEYDSRLLDNWSIRELNL
jgi:hypothetical protein